MPELSGVQFILARVTGAEVDFNKIWKAGKALGEISVIIFYKSLTAVTNMLKHCRFLQEY